MTQYTETKREEYEAPSITCQILFIEQAIAVSSENGSQGTPGDIWGDGDQDSDETGSGSDSW